MRFYFLEFSKAGSFSITSPRSIGSTWPSLNALLEEQEGEKTGEGGDEAQLVLAARLNPSTARDSQPQSTKNKISLQALMCVLNIHLDM